MDFRSLPLFLLVVLLFVCLPQSSGRPPNILFLIADDLGYGELTSYPADSPHGRMPTPNLDKFASEGIKFTSAYAGNPLCSPSRCSLMTGLHQGHAPIRGNLEVNLTNGERSDFPLPADSITLPEILKTVGYETAAVGKWGLGAQNSTGSPLEQGFGSFYGYYSQVYAHNYYPISLWDSNEEITFPANDFNITNPTCAIDFPENASLYCRDFCMDSDNGCIYSPDLLTARAVELLQGWKGSETPWFLYFAYIVPHAGGWLPNDNETGNPVPDDFNYTNPTWPNVELDHASMITNYLDVDMQTILQTLEDLGMAEDTLVIFSSDNGAQSEGGHNYTFFDSSGPLRGYKRSLYDGGLRVPFMARWPGMIPANITSDYAFAFYDLLPTFAQIAGVDMSILPEIDGTSMMNALFHEYEAPKPFFYWEFCTNGAWGHALRSGDWKIVSFAVNESLQLYNLVDDIGETNDLAATYPALVTALEQLAQEQHTDDINWPVEPCISS